MNKRTESIEKYPEASICLFMGISDINLHFRMIEYSDHLHEHFVHPVVMKDGNYTVPQVGYEEILHVKPILDLPQQMVHSDQVLSSFIRIKHPCDIDGIVKEHCMFGHNVYHVDISVKLI